MFPKPYERYPDPPKSSFSSMHIYMIAVAQDSNQQSTRIHQENHQHTKVSVYKKNDSPRVNNTRNYSINSSSYEKKKKRLMITGEFGWVGILVHCFLHKINPNPRKIICCGKKWPKCHFWPNFCWVELALGWGVRRFHNNDYMFPNPTEFRKSPTP